MTDITAPEGDEPHDEHGLSSLYNLVYCSRSTVGVDTAALTRILETARRDNPPRGITGLLVFGGGIFFQWLEGPRRHVKSLFARLLNDTRHDSLVTLTESEEVRERLFPDWNMESVAPDEIRDVLEDALDSATEAAHVAALRQMLAQLDSDTLRPLTAASA